MRPGQQQNKRMRGRGRGGRGPNPLSRSYESNGPDVKVRGTAAHVAEKYMQLARDAHSSGDPVAAESYLQHAEHYFRVIAAAQAQSQQQPGAVENQPRQRYNGADRFASDDSEDGDEQDMPRHEQPRQEASRQEPTRHEQSRHEQPRHEAPRHEAPRHETNRQEAPRQDVPQPAVRDAQAAPQPEGQSDEMPAPAPRRRRRRNPEAAEQAGQSANGANGPSQDRQAGDDEVVQKRGRPRRSSEATSPEDVGA